LHLPKRSALLLVAPLFIFLLTTFLVPIAFALLRSIQDPEFPRVFPETATALAAWDGQGLPGEKTAATFISEITAAKGTDELAVAAARLNTDINGFRSLLLKTARNMPREGDDPQATLVSIDPSWGDRSYWAAMKRAAGPLTGYYFLAALDLHRTDEGEIAKVPQNRQVFQLVMARTLWMAFAVTALCLLLGYPLAYLLANTSPRIANWLMLLILIPFWTSVLVRTTGWLVILQKNGLANYGLGALGLISEPLELIYNRFGVYVAMTHVLLSLMVLPIYSVMKGVGQDTMRAAKSLGARPMVAFWRVYVPQTRAGIAAGFLMVFVSAMGFYITPILIGGASDQMVAYFILFYTNEVFSPGMTGALSLFLLVASVAVYFAYLLIEGADSRKAA